MIEEADELLLQGGYLGLNLDELADRVEYSKATLYHHFSSKEDLVLAVVNRHIGIRKEFFTRGFLHEGNTRERMFAFGIADRILASLYPHGFPLQQLVSSDSIWGKCSETRRKSFADEIHSCVKIAMKVAHEAKENGDFESWSPPPEQMVWGLISLSKGAHLLDESPQFKPENSPGAPVGSPTQQGTVTAINSLYSQYHLYLDGAGWRPSSREFDFEASRKLIETNHFSQEMSLLQL